MIKRTAPTEVARVLLSIVVPCFNEEAVIRETHRRLVATLDTVPDLDFEIIYVDDGSRDATLNLLRNLQQADARVRVLALSRNFGHQMAVTAGLQHVAGQVVVLIDADLQDPPEVIPEMLDRWREGADVAYGVRTQRDGETRFKRWTANAFYRLLARLADISIPLDTGDFRLMDRTVVNAILAMPERDRFVRGMVAWTGFRQEPVPLPAGGPVGRGDRVAAQEDGASRHRRPCVVLPPAPAPGDLARPSGRRAGPVGYRVPAPLYRRLGPRLDVAPHRHPVYRRRAASDARHPRQVRGAHLRRSEAPPALSGQGTAGVPAHWPAGDAGRACG